MRSVKNDPSTETSQEVEFIAEQTEAKFAQAGAINRAPTIADIWEAHKLLKPLLHHTLLTPSRTLHEMTGADVYLKAENMQRSGSFKVRGASYKLSRLAEEEIHHGVIAASAGNHAQGIAIAAAQHHIPCTIVMPETAALAKVMATQSYGATVVLHGFTYDDAYQRCLELQRESGASLIHPFDDPDIIAGQGTLGLEMLSDLPDADAVIVPIGGGGLISGIAIAARALRRGCSELPCRPRCGRAIYPIGYQHYRRWYCRQASWRINLLHYSAPGRRCRSGRRRGDYQRRPAAAGTQQNARRRCRRSRSSGLIEWSSEATRQEGARTPHRRQHRH